MTNAVHCGKKFGEFELTSGSKLMEKYYILFYFIFVFNLTNLPDEERFKKDY